MTASPGVQYDFGLERRNLAALILLVLLAAVLLTGRAAGRRYRLGRHIGVQLERVLAAREKIDPNIASAASLRRLSGIGPAKARNIIAYRSVCGAGAFQSADDLRKVKGIGPGITERIAPHLDLPARRD
ncbi:MAG: helix-hairpin-helix domain-containing protein [Planctomycetota bacterium]|nr:helix-hairpin-helix domain-containing protein [Planctomycetota bacterium]